MYVGNKIKTRENVWVFFKFRELEEVYQVFCAFNAFCGLVSVAFVTASLELK